MPTFQCPRRAEIYLGQSPAFARDNDYDPSDDTCRYCGSLAPDTFMTRLEAGDVRLGATDKSYKVYVANDGGVPFRQAYRDCYSKGADGQMMFDENRQAIKKDPPCHGPTDCEHWVTRERDETKFYFQHLSDEQRDRFIELLNERKIKFQGGVGFYVLPYFAQRAGASAAGD